MNQQDQMFSSRFSRIGRALLFIFAGAVPLWFVPWQINVDFGREVTFLLLIFGALIAWLLSGLLTGKFRLVRSSAVYAGALFVLAASVSALVSKTPFASAFLNDPSAEKWSTLLAGFAVMIVAANVFSSRKDISRALVIFLLAAGAEAAMTFFSLAFHLSAFRAMAPGVPDDFNVIGTANGAALLYAASLIMALGFVFAPAFHRLRPWIQWAMYGALLFFVANLLIIHFRTAWIVLFATSLVFSGFMFWLSRGARQDMAQPADGSAYGAAKAGLGWKYGLSLVVLACSMVMIMMPSPLIGHVLLPTEVSPSAMTTLQIARSVYREGAAAALFGSGPATFNRDWMRYKDASINSTPFWNTQFSQGFSPVTTFAATMGVAGALSFALFAAGLVLIFLRSLLARRRPAAPPLQDAAGRAEFERGEDEDNTGFIISAFLGLAGMAVIAALYPANLAFMLLLFFFAGLLMTGLSMPEPRFAEAPEDKAAGGSLHPVALARGWWKISEHRFEFQQPWAVFGSSLGIVLLLSLSIGMVYYQVTRIQSAVAQVSGVAAANAGNLDGALSAFERALGYEDKNVRLHEALVQLRTEKIRGLIAAASQGKNVQDDFQKTFQAAQNNSQSALALSPEDPAVWQLQGALYELMIPYVPGIDRLAFESYQKEIVFDPSNPAGRINLARAGIFAADSMQLAMNQAPQGGADPLRQSESAASRDKVAQARSQTLDGVEKILQEAVNLKPDLAASHFLLAQVALRQGNIQKAIQSTENAKLAAPLDIGIAFQLGLLSYQNNNLNRARGEFERALSMNPQYSNARYFLGLIYSRTNNTDAAIAQFEEIAKYNPDNQEVKKILDNLHMGKPALDGIAPPATPPEQRSQPPVAESKQSSPVPAPQTAPVLRPRGGKK